MPVSERPRIKRETVTVRIEPQLRNLVDRAAELTGRRRTELVLDFARRAAEETILDETMFMVAPKGVCCFSGAPRSISKTQCPTLSRTAESCAVELKRAFYLTLGFDPSLFEPMTLMITLPDIRAALS
jgi:uncharacterized protein (DUF1778 family)